MTLFHTRRANTSDPLKYNWGAQGISLILINIPLTVTLLWNILKCFQLLLCSIFPQGLCFIKATWYSSHRRAYFVSCASHTDTVLQIRDCVLWSTLETWQIISKNQRHSIGNGIPWNEIVMSLILSIQYNHRIIRILKNWYIYPDLALAQHMAPFRTEQGMSISQKGFHSFNK